MKRFLSAILLISLGISGNTNIAAVMAAEKTPVLNAGAEEINVDTTKTNVKKKKKKDSKVHSVIMEDPFGDEENKKKKKFEHDIPLDITEKSDKELEKNNDYIENNLFKEAEQEKEEKKEAKRKKKK